VTIDAGTGDGRAVLATAAREPATLVLGLDASAAAMTESSRRAARAERKGGLPNARFVVAAAEAPPDELAGVAHLVTVRFPWGSLLRGVVGSDDAVAPGLAGLVAANGALELLLAPIERDGLDGVPTDAEGLVAGADAAFRPFGFELETVCRPTTEDVGTTGSTWARRLGTARAGAAPERQPTLIRLVRR
jgi:16S rRNA (adenine(1408)-N(1))-methyltransferase